MQGFIHIGTLVNGPARILGVQWGANAALDVAQAGWAPEQTKTLYSFEVATKPDEYYVMVVNGEFSEPIARPMLPAPPSLTAGVAADWALPEGSVVTVDPLNGAAVVSETVTSTFSIGLAAGDWRVVVNPPFPWIRAEWRIEVAA